MLWLSRPPYWRWFAAAAVIAGAAYVDLADPPTERYPYVAMPAGTGEPVVVAWKEIPRGVLPPHGEITGVAKRSIAAGTPLVDGLLAPPTSIPDDWWAIAVELPTAAVAGREVMIITRAPPLEVTGVVITPAASSGFGSVSPGLVAIPPAAAAIIANAVTERRATVLVRP